MAIEDITGWTCRELLEYVDLHMKGCSDPGCGVCREGGVRPR